MISECGLVSQLPALCTVLLLLVLLSPHRLEYPISTLPKIYYNSLYSKTTRSAALLQNCTDRRPSSKAFKRNNSSYNNHLFKHESYKAVGCKCFQHKRIYRTLSLLHVTCNIIHSKYRKSFLKAHPITGVHFDFYH
jgi:hypothetical protein